ncbi:CRISPR-associated helicase/endonuclease Cas3 [Amycolatopsis cihanbeyliensis]
MERVADSGRRVAVPHKELGAALVVKRAGAAALGVLGHHGGLPGLGELRQWMRGPGDLESLERFFGEVPEARGLMDGEVLLPDAWVGDARVLEVGVRMVFSALVDADHLDTAAHFDDLDGPRVRSAADMDGLVRRFERCRSELLEERSWSPIDEVRAGLYESVVARAGLRPGVYRLPAPTGSGKTLTAGGFALRHAAEHGLARVIVAVPFTTITEQNAEVYRKLLGEDVVLEHHSNTEIDQRRMRLAAENWDAPFVVTTTVQLFDSLFGRMPARSRKLHRLANAVVVLDEVQALPVSLLVPILDVLRILSEHFRTTVLLASATQPSFESLAVWQSLPVQELVDEPVELFRRLRRVEYEWRVEDPRPTLEEVAQDVAAERQALVVVNTVGHARRLYRAVAMHSPGRWVFHLSTRMCPRHRQAVLAQVQQLLGAGESVWVVSTQLIEAGVDVDFPVVFRALAPAESLQQAAGRANREGLRPEPGRVVVFDAVDAPVPMFYRAGVAKTLGFFGPGRAQPDDPDALAAYYRSLYRGLNVDRAGRGVAIQENRARLDFPAVADGPLVDPGAGVARDRRLAFRMIDEDAVAVVVAGYTDRVKVEGLLEQVRNPEGPVGDALRKLRGYTVSIPRAVAADPAVRALCRPVVAGREDLWEWCGDYDLQVGVDEGEIGKETVW